MSRFDYIAYDKETQEKQMKLKLAATVVEKAMAVLDEAQQKFFNLIEELLDPNSREAELANEELRVACLSEDCLDRLEQAYMWCGKALRDEQIKRNGEAVLQECRGE